MGILINNKAVSLNFQVENGVDTSLTGNPSGRRLYGVPAIYVFKRKRMTSREDDGNPLIHALKGRNGFTITKYWRDALMARAEEVLFRAKQDIGEQDYCMPIPSSSTFVSEFAELVAKVTGAPFLPPTFLRKSTIGEVLHDCATEPPRFREAQRSAYTSQLNSWQRSDPQQVFQAKHVDVSIRPLFKVFRLCPPTPALAGRRILVVDDIFATGASFSSVKKILDQLGSKSTYCSFLSGL